MKRTLTGREQNLIIAAITLVFCSLFIVYLIVPLWQNYALVKSDLDNTTAGWEKLQAQKKAGSANKDIAKIENEVKQMRKQIPSVADTAGLIYYLNQAAAKSGVSLNGFEAAVPENRNKYREQEQTEDAIDAKVSITGTYSQIRNFVVQTESLTRLTHNKAINITEARNTSGKLEATIEFLAFIAERGAQKYTESDVPRAGAGRPTPFRY